MSRIESFVDEHFGKCYSPGETDERVNGSLAPHAPIPWTLRGYQY